MQKKRRQEKTGAVTVATTKCELRVVVSCLSPLSPATLERLSRASRGGAVRLGTKTKASRLRNEEREGDILWRA